MSSPFTLTIDWLAFTLPSGSVEDTMHILGGDWTKSEVGFRGYPLSWLRAGAGRGVGKLGTGALRAPREVHVNLSAGIVASWPLEKVRTIMQWVLRGEGHLTRLDCALDDRNSSVPLSTIRQAIEAGQCVTRADRMQRTFRRGPSTKAHRAERRSISGVPTVRPCYASTINVWSCNPRSERIGRSMASGGSWS